MRRIPIILALLLSGALSAMSVEVGSIRGFLYGIEPNCGYDNWVSHLVEGTPVANNHYAPWDIQNTGFGNYRYPSEDDLLQWGELIQAWLAQDFPRADSLIVQYELPYELIHFHDTDQGREYYMLRELLNDDIDYNNSDQAAIIEEGSFDYGWGLYIFNPKASRQMMISAVHPCDDYPSPIIAMEAMLLWDARFLFIAGAGREALITGNSNNSSISDPSRHQTHAFNVAYQLACQQIRDLTGKIEFSVQMHSFDWQTHPTLKPVVVSAGGGRIHPSLPIVDESQLKKDLFHHTPWEVLPENALGTHPAITIEDYYTVYSQVPIECEASGQAAVISTSAELPGYIYNRQMLFTEQPNIFDSYSPFFHVEMAELPIFLPQDQLSWQKFYGWDEVTERWIMSERWTLFIQCYSPWLEAMNEVLDDLLRMDDYLAPTNPDNFRVSSLGQDVFGLEWDRSYDYDFDSYEIIVTYQSEGEETEVIVDREVLPILARQSKTSAQLSFDGFGSPMLLRLRARDKHGRCSQETEEIFLFRPDPQLGSFQNVSIAPQTGSIVLSFDALFQNQAHYRIKRSVNGGTYEELATLPSVPSGNYQYEDTEVNTNCFYRYRIGVVLTDNTQLWHHQTLAAQPLSPVKISLSRPQNGLVDRLIIGYNHYAKDGLDPLDIHKAPPATNQPYVWLASETEDPELHLSRDLRAPYDQLTGYKTWSLSARISMPNSDLVISSDIVQSGVEGDLLLWDEADDKWHDLRYSSYFWNNGNSFNRNFKLYWGFREPEIYFYDLPRQVAEAGSEIELTWQVINPSHLQNLELWMYDRSDSLLVDPLISPLQGSYTWQSPGTAFCGYRLMIKALDNEERLLRFLSPYLYDLVPPTVQVDIPAGFSILCVPVENWTANVGTDFPPGTNAWRLTPTHGWIMAYDFDSSEAYVLDCPTATSLTYSEDTRMQSFSKELQQGWNLVPNAHYHRYDLSQIQLIMDGEPYSYAELEERHLVSHKPYILTSRGWELVDEIQPNTGFLFQYFGSAPCSLLLDPQVLPSEHIVSPPKPWELMLSVYCGTRGRDGIQIGSSVRGSDSEITHIDSPKPYRFNNQGLQIYLSGPDDEVLQSKYKSPYPGAQATSKTWDIVIVKTLNHPLTIEADCSKIPQDFEAKLQLLDQSYPLVQGQSIQVDLPSGVFPGSVEVIGRSTHNLDECYLGLKVYPNPFCETIIISWDDAKGPHKPKAQVYNIRGQRVCSLNISEASGKFTATWDGRDQNNRRTAKGLYLIKIEHSSRRFVKKVIKY